MAPPETSNSKALLPASLDVGQFSEGRTACSRNGPLAAAGWNSENTRRGSIGPMKEEKVMGRALELAYLGFGSVRDSTGNAERSLHKTFAIIVENQLGALLAGRPSTVAGRGRLAVIDAERHGLSVGTTEE